MLLFNPSEKGKIMDKITRIGVDLAKNIIQVHGVDSMKRVVVRKAISRQKFPEWFANSSRAWSQWKRAAQPTTGGASCTRSATKSA
uniref:hypothetical protein n=1 Tax=Paraburkholderia sp. RL17-373-BIF-A TaxID=3031629 RepID=UPI0038BC19DD